MKRRELRADSFDDDPLTLKIKAAFAEEEARQISKRTKDAEVLDDVADFERRR